jgi:hypothetical protein
MRHRMRPRASSLVDVKAVPRPILRTRPSSLAGPRGFEPRTFACVLDALYSWFRGSLRRLG